MLTTVAADLLSLTLVSAPGEQGADIAVGSAQRFGVPLFFGGPHAGYMSVRSGLERMLPGRLVGVSVDVDGKPAYRLALQTREQHIRRDKATSNICTAQALLANVAAMYAAYHGPEGLRAIATRVHGYAVALAAGLRAAGREVVHDRFFDTVMVRVPGGARQIVSAADDAGINLRQVDADHVGISCDECTTDDVIRRVLEVFGVAPAVSAAGAFALPDDMIRTSDYLTHPVFHRHRSETAMLRFLRELSDKDLALDRTMIPLGSCTMKLNAAAELEPISWPGFAGIHPYAPAEQTSGYLELIGNLEDWLAAITGYDRVSLQPNAGSQGELAGLLAIKAYHHSRGEQNRDVCLIPQSAHGTNAASAVLAGMRVVVVKTAPNGNIDHDDLEAKLVAHDGQVAAIMLTYPSTHGVYEADVRTVCELVHDAGGQVYVDGANLNALVGLAKPGEFGGDVSHLNLHKTFCIPHGGGGPGVGPVAVRAHLAPFLPGDPMGTEAIRTRTSKEQKKNQIVINALTKVGESITFSALTVIAALLSLLAASFQIYSNLGIPLAIGIGIMLLAGLTLLPALLAIFGKAAFWPSKPKPGTSSAGLWGNVATRVVKRPAVALLIGVIAFGALSIGGHRVQERWVRRHHLGAGRQRLRGRAEPAGQVLPVLVGQPDQPRLQTVDAGLGGPCGHRRRHHPAPAQSALHRRDRAAQPGRRGRVHPGRVHRAARGARLRPAARHRARHPGRVRRPGHADPVDPGVPGVPRDRAVRGPGRHHDPVPDRADGRRSEQHGRAATRSRPCGPRRPRSAPRCTPPPAASAVRRPRSMTSARSPTATWRT